MTTNAVYKCADKDCGITFRFCSKCCGIAAGAQAVICKTCWYKHGQICSYCNVKAGQNNMKKRRSCRECHSNLFCGQCEAPPPSVVKIRTCTSCANAALWCSAHCTEQEIASGLCRAHFDSNECHYCYNKGSTYTWEACSTSGCDKIVRSCDTCKARFCDGQLLCDPCWSLAGATCIACKTTPTRNERKYLHRCHKCFNLEPVAWQYKQVHKESEEYLQKREEEQMWDGSEPAFRLFVLGTSTDSKPLPKYAPTAEFLHPNHCRLCLQECQDLDKHIREHHGGELKNRDDYRSVVLNRAFAEWPQEITPQILRTRLAAYKMEMSDANFAMSVCACCARQKRQCKLTQVVFPARLDDTCPAWLGWELENWKKYAHAWFAQVDDILNIDNYLQNIFLVNERLERAEMRVKACESGEPIEGDFESVDVARAWRDRVQCWTDNLRTDLTRDSVPAPGDKPKRWLLFPGSALTVTDCTGDISCHLCKRCCSALGKDARFGQILAKMPLEARANGLWHGPDPEELSRLTYTECKVINLARLFVSVKRIYLDRGSFAGTAKDEAPHYHTNNVVAYPQSPEAALTALGCTPEALAQTILIQFTRGDEHCLKQHPDIQVSVPNLRAAFRWLCMNNWQFMDATKDHAVWKDGTLHQSLEDLLNVHMG